MSATTRLESIPPLSIAPSGTSLIRRSRTASSSRSRSSSPPALPRASARIAGRRMRVLPVPLDPHPVRVGDEDVPGISFETPASGVRGPGTKPSERYASIASKSSVGRTSRSRAGS